MIRRFIPSPDKKKGLPGANEMEGWARSNRYGAGAKRKTWKKHVVYSLGKMPKFKRIWLEITYYEPNKKRDPDNIAAFKKILIDALVEAGAIENDGWKQVAGWKEIFRVDKENPGIEISIWDGRGEL